MKLQNIVKIISLIIGVIAAFFLIRIMMLGDEAIVSDADNQGIVSSFITLALIVVIIAAALTLIFTLKNLFTHPAKLKQAMISLVLFGIIIAVAYIMSTGTEQVLEEGKILTSSESRWVETGIRTFYFLIVIAVGAMLFGGVRKFINK